MTGQGPATVAVIAIGEELLSGEVADSNFPEIASALTGLGFSVIGHTTLPDDTERISLALKELSPGVDVIITTGGLGPTVDDVTREAVAHATGAKLLFRDDIAALIRGFFEALKRPMSDENLKQAYLPEGAVEIPPAGGTAPGFMLDHEGALIISLPGVPKEMTSMLRSHVLPELERRFSSGQVNVTRRVMTFGAGESDVASLLSDLAGSGEVRYGFLALGGPVEVKLTATSRSRGEAMRLLDIEEEKVRGRLGPLVYAIDGEAMEAVVGRLLRDAGLTIAVAESCTAGMVTARITGVPGSSDYLLGGVVVYSADSKKKILGLSEDTLAGGTVSRAVARAMAESVCRIFRADIGLAVTGVAGPGRGGEQKPVGTVGIGLSHGSLKRSWEVLLPGDREMVRNIATMAALNAVRLHIHPPDSNPRIPQSWIPYEEDS